MIKKMGGWLMGLGLVIVLTGCGGQKSPVSSSSAVAKSADQTTVISETAETTTNGAKENSIVKSSRPTVFIHGYSGGWGSFGGMISRLSGDGTGLNELSLTVDAAGTVTSKGKLSGEKTNPLIQVLFENNQTTDENYATWIAACLAYLKQEYNINEVNLVGHSQGGVAVVKYLGEYSEDAQQPKLTKAVVIAAPFNDFTDTAANQSLDDEIQQGPTVKNSRYTEIFEVGSQFPVDLPLLVIAGQLSGEDLSDGTVPLTSALAGIAPLRQAKVAVSYQVFTGKNAQHSLLHENTAVDQAVTNFLWGK